MTAGPFTAAQVANHVGGEVEGNAELELVGVLPLA